MGSQQKKLKAARIETFVGKRTVSWKAGVNYQVTCNIKYMDELFATNPGTDEVVNPPTFTGCTVEKPAGENCTATMTGENLPWTTKLIEIAGVVFNEFKTPKIKTQINNCNNGTHNASLTAIKIEQRPVENNITTKKFVESVSETYEVEGAKEVHLSGSDESETTEVSEGPCPAM